MNEKQQIEEMANILWHIPHGYSLNSYNDCEIIAECIYNDGGFRKQGENTVELPCKVGDKVWCISNYTKPKEFQITILTISENHYSFVIEANKGVYKHYCDKDSVGKYVFFTKEEAEKALTKMKGGAE